MTKPNTYPSACPAVDKEESRAFVSACLATQKANAAAAASVPVDLSPLETSTNLQSARGDQEEPICLDDSADAGCLACQGRHRPHSCGKPARAAAKPAKTPAKPAKTPSTTKKRPAGNPEDLDGWDLSRGKGMSREKGNGMATDLCEENVIFGKKNKKAVAEPTETDTAFQLRPPTVLKGSSGGMSASATTSGGPLCLHDMPIIFEAGEWERLTDMMSVSVTAKDAEEFLEATRQKIALKDSFEAYCETAYVSEAEAVLWYALKNSNRAMVAVDNAGTLRKLIQHANDARDVDNVDWPQVAFSAQANGVNYTSEPNKDKQHPSDSDLPYEVSAAQAQANNRQNTIDNSAVKIAKVLQLLRV